MKVTDLRNKNEQELKELIQKTRKELEELVTNIIKGKEKNVKKVRPLRKEVARIKTVISEKVFLREGKNDNA
ncbi:50S ribosomal protein L29 [candidate division WWE3 bacterium RIFCSPLOWO2_01_FULL_37_15]|uniref:Large ribosomal subunit protein uL29 n=1 Tax=candidate division WWE3 bacterium RIFCSPLOWO2_01_FULL_37_15 TaxID=1802622 RepID=A0A1F4V0E4_UNCKA|nr:MAG: 50S ribosomal protein L29 [candidate division WWE3 bacterium RIFCSPLOWO2_01_FULL_37_15]